MRLAYFWFDRGVWKFGGVAPGGFRDGDKHYGKCGSLGDALALAHAAGFVKGQLCGSGGRHIGHEFSINELVEKDALV